MRRNRPLIGDIREQSYRDVERESSALNYMLRCVYISAAIMIVAFIIFRPDATDYNNEAPVSNDSYLITNLTKSDKEEIAPIYVHFTSDSRYDTDRVTIKGDITSGCVPDHSDKDQLVIVSCTDSIRRGNMITYLKNMGYTNIKTDSSASSVKYLTPSPY